MRFSSVGSGLWGKRPRQWVTYDLARDPLEQSPRPVTNQTLRAGLERHLRVTMQRLTAKPNKKNGRTPEALPDDVVDQLKALGYVE